MGSKTGIEWTDSTWSPVRFRVKQDAAQIAREKGYTSLVQIAERMAGHVGSHCEHVSPGCENCYAETNNHRCLPANGTGLPYDRRSRDLVEPFIDEKALLQPFKWGPIPLGGGRVEYEEAGPFVTTKPVTRPRRIFVENQSDPFAEWVTDEMLDRVFAVMALCPQHTFQVLTKRPERMFEYFQSFHNPDAERRGFNCCSWVAGQVHQKYLPPEWIDLISKIGSSLPNVWLGMSVENQKAADERIPLLLQTPAAVRFLSCEPMLGAVDLRRVCLQPQRPGSFRAGIHLNALQGTYVESGCPYIGDWDASEGIAPPSAVPLSLDWVICGGESGHGARPMHPDWARELRDQCLAAGVPFFFKQWGEWGPLTDQPNESDWSDGQAIVNVYQGDIRGYESLADETTWLMQRVGKKAAGSCLDGQSWKQFPEGR